jgi:hypothetical protein
MIDVQMPNLEKPIANFKDLRKILTSLELDEGVRILGNIQRLRGGGFIFVSIIHTAKTSHKYCVNLSERIYDKKAKLDLPDGKEEFLYFLSIEDLMEFIKENTTVPLRAWIY